ncbi:hypothetical protein BCR44DRAFT_41191 [Catenaria anguillulae PL171]|uniref:Uncharacterized protein n=1 Tax=Catenaria anguillulae PL171 TaxID=765915 RepID=A0A1Y2HEF2_9FUNG|nr:hypothetical protein BCR44DRAFT_41191 [Catenaria anguillulae PL171]
MSATISSLVSGAVVPPPPPPTCADATASRDPSATQPLTPAQLSPFPPIPAHSSSNDDSASIHALPSSDPSAFDPAPRVRANSFPTSKREWSAAEARQAAAEASGKSGWKKRWRKIRNLFKAMRGAFRSSSSSKSDAGSVIEKDERGLLMVPKRKHKATMVKEVLPPPMPPVPPVPPLPEIKEERADTGAFGVYSVSHHHIAGSSPSPIAAENDADDDSTPLALLNSPELAPPRIPAIPFPPASAGANNISPPPSPPLHITPPQLLITLDDGYVYEAFTIERAHVVFPRRSTDSTVPTVDRRRRVRRRSKTPAADEGEQPAISISTEAANALNDDEAPPLPSPTPTWASSESLERSSVLASTLDRMLRRKRETPGSAEQVSAQHDDEDMDVMDHRGYCTATDTESELESPAAGPSAVSGASPVDDKALDEGFVAELGNDDTHPPSPTDALPPVTSSPSLSRNSISSFDLSDLAHSTPLPLSPTSAAFISSSPPASSVSLTPSDSGVAHDDEHEHEHVEPAPEPDQVVDSGTHSDDLADSAGAPTASPPSIQITLDDGFAYDAFTIERAHKVFPRRAAEPGSGVATIDRRRRVRRRSEIGGAEQQQKQKQKQAPTSVE